MQSKQLFSCIFNLEGEQYLQKKILCKLFFFKYFVTFVLVSIRLNLKSTPSSKQAYDDANDYDFPSNDSSSKRVTITPFGT